MTLGDFIRQFRKEHGMSMDAFAQASGLSKAYVSILERNINPTTKKPVVPSIVTFKCVSLATGIELDDILAQVDENQPVYLVANKAPSGSMKLGSKLKPFRSDKSVRIPSFKIDSTLYNSLVMFAEDNDRSLEDEIEIRLYESCEETWDEIDDHESNGDLNN